MNRHISANTVHIISKKKSTNPSTGALTVVGGAGIGKNLIVNEDITANELILNSSGKIKKNLYIDGDLVVKGKINKQLFKTIEPQIIKINKDKQRIHISQPLVFLEANLHTTITSIITAPNNAIIRIIIIKYTHADFPILKWKINNEQDISFEELNDHIDLIWKDKKLIYIGGNTKPSYVI